MSPSCRRSACVFLLAALAAEGLADVPRGWQWTIDCPFRELTVAASSEQEDQWPASKAIDGDTSEPDGIWQTINNNPQAAWLELRLKRPRRVKGVSIFHQLNPGYYRSIDYAIACWADGAWTTVADVKGEVIACARRLRPAFPGCLDEPAISIGIGWCTATECLCDGGEEDGPCPLSGCCRRNTDVSIRATGP